MLCAISGRSFCPGYLVILFPLCPPFYFFFPTQFFFFLLFLFIFSILSWFVLFPLTSICFIFFWPVRSLSFLLSQVYRMLRVFSLQSIWIYFLAHSLPRFSSFSLFFCVFSVVLGFSSSFIDLVCLLFFFQNSLYPSSCLPPISSSLAVLQILLHFPFVYFPLNCSFPFYVPPSVHHHLCISHCPSPFSTSFSLSMHLPLPFTLLYIILSLSMYLSSSHTFLYIILITYASFIALSSTSLSPSIRLSSFLTLL